jgi:hypothetical protein
MRYYKSLLALNIFLEQEQSTFNWGGCEFHGIKYTFSKQLSEDFAKFDC